MTAVSVEKLGTVDTATERVQWRGAFRERVVGCAARAGGEQRYCVGRHWSENTPGSGVTDSHSDAVAAWSQSDRGCESSGAARGRTAASPAVRG